MTFPIYGKIKNLPNHQPDSHDVPLEESQKPEKTEKQSLLPGFRVFSKPQLPPLYMSWWRICTHGFPWNINHHSTIWWFPQIGLPPNIDLNRIFHHKPSSYWDPKSSWKPPYKKPWLATAKRHQSRGLLWKISPLLNCYPGPRESTVHISVERFESGFRTTPCVARSGFHDHTWLPSSWAPGVDLTNRRINESTVCRHTGSLEPISRHESYDICG